MSPRRGGRIAGGGIDAAERAGITRRQLDYWLQREIIVPQGRIPHPGSGVPRSLTSADVTALAVLGRIMPLRDAMRDDVTDRIREIVRHVQEHGAVGEFELIPGVTVDLEVLLADDSAAVVS